MDVAHVKAHRRKKEKEKMTQLDMFATEGDEKVVELAKAGAMLDEGFMTEAKAQNYEAGARGGVRSLAVRSQLSLLGGRMERL